VLEKNVRRKVTKRRPEEVLAGKILYLPRFQFIPHPAGFLPHFPHQKNTATGREFNIKLI